MNEIKKTINHLCSNIQNGTAARKGWTPEDVKKLAESILLLTQAAATLRPAPVSAEEAARVVWETCRRYDCCADCPLGKICDAEPPYTWDLPAREADA